MARPGDTFVLARVPEAIREVLLRLLLDSGLDRRLGRALFAPHNWHQSLSGIHPPAARDALLQACTQLEARAFTLRLEQLRSSGHVPGRIHWAFVPQGRKPPGLAMLLADVCARLEAHGLPQAHGHRAHVTISYQADEGVATHAIAPVDWLIDSVELVQVAGRGADYRYEVVQQFPLRPADHLPAPLDLLG